MVLENLDEEATDPFLIHPSIDAGRPTSRPTIKRNSLALAYIMSQDTIIYRLTIGKRRPSLINLSMRSEVNHQGDYTTDVCGAPSQL